MTHLEAFYFALGINPDTDKFPSITEIDTPAGKLTIVEFCGGIAVKDPQAPLDPRPHGQQTCWRTVKCSGPSFLFLNGGRPSVNWQAGYQMTINVTERNVLDDLEVECRKLAQPTERITEVLRVLDQVRNRNLECAKKHVMPTE